MVSCGSSILAVDEESEAQGEDSSAGLPEHTGDHLIADGTGSPDKIAVIYPTSEKSRGSCRGREASGAHGKIYIVASSL